MRSTALSAVGALIKPPPSDGRRRSAPAARPISGTSRHPRVFARGQALLPQSGEGGAHPADHAPMKGLNELAP